MSTRNGEPAIFESADIEREWGLTSNYEITFSPF
jgi:hypothetical protein